VITLECGGLPPLSLAELAPPVKSGSKLPHSKVPWPHAPEHRLGEAGTFMVTAGTYQKEHFFNDGSRLRLLHNALLTITNRHEWRLEAWAVFPNHYHFVAHSPRNAGTLHDLLRELHSRTAVALNRYDGTLGRKIWHNYWDTQLTHQVSYLARLNYVHQNAVKHGIVSVASQYPWCSADWFEKRATPAQMKTLYSFKTERLRVHDDF
jgi:putative transposase